MLNPLQTLAQHHHVAAPDLCPGLLWTADTRLRVTSISGALAGVLGIRCDKALGMRASHLLREGTDGRVLREMARALKGNAVQFRSRCRTLLLRHTLQPVVSPEGSVIGLAGYSCQAAGDAAAAEDFDLRSALSLAEAAGTIGTFSMNASSGEMHIGATVADLLGFARGTRVIDEAEFVARIHPDDRSSVKNLREKALRRRAPYAAHYRIVLPTGQIRHVKSAGLFILDPQGNAWKNIGALTDVTPDEEAESNPQISGRDELTGLPRRRLFLQTCKDAFEAAKSTDHLALVIFDLDTFSRLNDTLGSLSGDLVLRTVASRLVAFETSVLTCARVGADEFACLIRGFAGRGALANLVESLSRAINEPIDLGGSQVRMTATFGISLFPDDGRDMTLFERAHLALFSGKGDNVGSVQWYEPELERELHKSYRSAREIRDAVNSQEFVLHYQPIVDDENELVCAEALLRWQHPTRGLLLPRDFIALVDEPGIIEELGAWVLKAACKDAVEMGRRLGGPLRIHVNLSPHQLRDPRFCELVKIALRETGLPAALLTFEITEQSLIVSDPCVLETLQGLRAMEIRLSVDDFGTGYNTLKYLKNYPITSVKIDRSFIVDLEHDPYSRAICTGVISIASALGFDVIAEGVETQGQYEALRGLGCTRFQGYLFGVPCPEPQFKNPRVTLTG